MGKVHFVNSISTHFIRRLSGDRENFAFLLHCQTQLVRVARMQNIPFMSQVLLQSRIAAECVGCIEEVYGAGVDCAVEDGLDGAVDGDGLLACVSFASLKLRVE